ncbi:MAG TPA: DoxX family membrane protein [Candidatus Binatia bacterium]|jgi:hypothetical protein|nr:DoxX family membrane protein [Candidatus Binatia bacterium]
MRDKLRTWIFPTGTKTRLALALFILRLFVGIAFIQHGSGKLMHPSEFAAEFGIPVWLALATMSTQLIGGILLILGALTPLAALSIDERKTFDIDEDFPFMLRHSKHSEFVLGFC